MSITPDAVLEGIKTVVALSQKTKQEHSRIAKNANELDEKLKSMGTELNSFKSANNSLS